LANGSWQKVVGKRQLATFLYANNMDSKLATILPIKTDLTHTIGSDVSLPWCKDA
jgi:hypothetical protein